MAEPFKPPPLESYQGQAGGFTPPPPVEDKAPNEALSLRGIGNAFVEQGKGIVKQLGRDAYGVAKTLANGPSGIPDVGWTGLDQKVQAKTEPSNTGQKIGGWLGTAGEVAVPEAMAAGAPSALGGLRNAAEHLYQGALRPRPSLGVDAAKGLVRTGLAERIPVSEKGVNKVGGIVNDLNTQIGQHIAGSTAEIDPRNVAKSIDTVHPSFAAQVNPEADVNTLRRVKGEYLGKHIEQIPYTKVVPGQEEEAGRLVPTGPGTTPLVRAISPGEAQAEKVATYRQLSGKYGGELSSADIEGQKALARGLRSEIGTAVPAVHPLNAREGKLLELQEPLQRAVVRGGNADVVPIGGTTVSIARKLLDNPAMKSNAAIHINRLSKAPVTGRGLLGGAVKVNRNLQENQ